MTDALVPSVDVADAALVPSPDVAGLEGLPVNEIDAALGVVWQSFGRRTVVDAWHIGRALRRVRETLPGRRFAPYCERIQMTRSWAYKLLSLADGPLSQVSTHRTVDGAVKALNARPEPEPAEPAATPRPTPRPTPVPAPVEPEPTDPEAVIDAVAAEVELTPAELRDERLERLAIMTEHLDGDLVDGWALKLDKAMAEKREAVAASNEDRRRRLAAERKLQDFIDALLVVPRGEGDAGIDDVLASRGIARKAA